jgi:hypothetical protein
MNKRARHKILWTRVRLLPAAVRCRLAADGQTDDTWIVTREREDGFDLENDTHHVLKLGHDCIHQYNKDLNRGKGHGILILTCQVIIDGDKVSTKPIVGPPPGRFRPPKI